MTRALIIARHVLEESVRRRVFLIVLVLTILFLALFTVATIEAFNARLASAAGAAEFRRHDRGDVRHAVRTRDVRIAVPRGGAGGLSDARRRPWRRRTRPVAAARRQTARANGASARAVRRRVGRLRVYVVVLYGITVTVIHARGRPLARPRRRTRTRARGGGQ